MKKLTIFFFTLLLIPTFALSASETDCYLSSGFGNANANGTFENNSFTNNGEPTFINENGWFLASDNIDSGYWVIRDTLTGINGDYASQYYNSDAYNSNPAGHTWAYQIIYGGTAPAGTVSLTDCPGGGSGTTTPSSTDGPTFQEWLFVNGIIIGLLSYPLWGRIFIIKKT